MKKLLLLSLCICNISLVNAITIPLSTKDSIQNFMIFAPNFAKTIYGRSALFISGKTEFLIGVFDSNHNDSLDALDVVSIAQVRDKEYSLFNHADQVNSNYAKKIQYLVVKENCYSISAVGLTAIEMEASNKTTELKNYNYIHVLSTIWQFDSLLVDSAGIKVDPRQFYEPGMINVFYYTTMHCPPCERLKPLVQQLTTSRKINLVIITNNVYQDYSGYKKKFYFPDMHDPSEFWGHGFPEILVFDKKGNFIESDNSSAKEKSEDLLRRYGE